MRCVRPSILVVCLFAIWRHGYCLEEDSRFAADNEMHRNSSHAPARSLSTIEIVLGMYGPITSVSQTFLASAIAFDLDFRKNFEPALVTRFGPPIVKIPKLNPNLRIKLQIGTSNSDPDAGVATGLDFILGQKGLSKVAGIIGGYHSAISMPVASLAAVMKTPQVSWASTSPKLSNKGAYPYFCRTIPPDSIQGAGMWEFIIHFKVPSVSYLYSSEPYGEGLYTTVANLAANAKQAFRITGMGVKYMPKSYDVALAEKKVIQCKEEASRFIMLAMTTDQAVRIFYLLEKHGMYDSPNYQLIGSEAINVVPGPTPAPKKPLQKGFIRFSPISRGALFPKFEAMWNKLKAVDVTGAASIARYQVDKMQVTLDKAKSTAVTDAMFKNLDAYQLEDPFIFDAGYAFVIAFSDMLNAGITKDKIKEKLLLDEVKKANFEGISGPVAFDKSGDRLASYTIENTQDVTKVKLVIVAEYSASKNAITMKEGTTIMWMSGDTGPKLPKSLIACANGFFEELSTLMCRQCETGSWSDNSKGNVKKCTRCAAGKFAQTCDSKGVCKGVKFGATTCGNCSAGTYSTSADVSETCGKCTPGYFADREGMSFCDKCPVSTYATNASASKCTSCGGVLTTMDTAVADPKECVCPANTYRTLKNTCEGCPPGMICTAGSFAGLLKAYESKLDDTNRARKKEKAPTVKKGFYSRSEKPLSVYECNPRAVCPGIVPQKCAGARKSFMCTECPTDYITNNDLEDDETKTGCSKCEAFKMVYLIVFPLVALVALFAILWDTRHSPLNDGPLQVEIMQVGGQCIMFMQILGAMQAASLRYGEPFTGFMNSITEPIEMDLFFSATPCIYFGFGDAATAFLSQVLLPAIFVMVLAVVFFVSNTIRKGLFNGEGLLNAIGEVLIEFYVSITIAVMAPFKCYNHPNGESSMVFRPEVLCGESTHMGMQAVAVIGLLLYPINCFCTTCFAVYKHPKAMAKNDIGMLVRCHFLFNRWSPASYWFAVVAVSRNFFVALWPMVIPQEQMDFAVMLMVSTLLVALLWACWVKPRRTPAMNKLDVWISFVQIVILAVGSMSIYQEDTEAGIKSKGLSTVLIILTISVFFIAAVIALLKSIQLLSKGTSPGSWAFDIFIDFHGGLGANGVRSLQLILATVVKQGKVFYDYDSHINNGYLGVITDAVKLSKNCVVVLGTETWCRSWCVAAICGAVQKRIPMQTMTIEGAPFEVITTDERVLKMLCNQAPRALLRPIGIRDQSIPEAITAVCALKPTNFDMISLDSAKGFVDDLLGNLRNVRPGIKATDFVTEFFCKSSMSRMMSVVQSPQNKWYGGEDCGNASVGSGRVLSRLYALLSCDHEDPEAIAVSRLMYMSLTTSLHACQIGGNVKKLDSYDMSAFSVGEQTALMEIGIIEDVDLDAPEFDDLVTNKRIAVVVALMTDNTLSSQPQLFRLGHIHKFTNPRAKLVPVAIRSAFNFPCRKVLDGIESGKTLNLKDTAAQASVRHTTKEVSMGRVVTAVMDCLEATISLVDLPKVSGENLKACVNKVLLRIVYATRDFKESREENEQDDVKAMSIFGCERSSRASTTLSMIKDPVEEQPAKDGETLEVCV